MDEGTQEKVRHLFSDEERRNIVRSFIEAYMREEVKIKFPTKEEAESIKEDFETFSGEKINQRILVSIEHLTKKSFKNLVLIATGALKANQGEIQAAIDGLFNWIITLRQGERIEGEFLAIPNVEARLVALENRMTSIESLIEEIRASLRIQRQPP